MSTTNPQRCERIAGLLVGAAVGDAIGLPRENMSARRASRIFGAPPMRHAFIFRWGMCSDDTEHAVITAQAWLDAGGDIAIFERKLAWGLRRWLLGLPAGVGLATLKSIIRLWLGVSPARSGVFSAGNGPAMRAPIIGALARSESDCEALNHVSSRMTHSDPRAEAGAQLVAFAAREAINAGPDVDATKMMARLCARARGEQLRERMQIVQALLNADAAPQEFLDRLGLNRGVSGYINDTVPAAIFCWLRYRNDFRIAVECIIQMGGDTDSTGAIVGALAGATLGRSAIPRDWVENVWEWPRSVRWLDQLAGRLSSVSLETPRKPKRLPLFWPGLILRNLLFTIIVLLHALRRLLPPY